MSGDRRFGEPVPQQSHYFDEAMVVHDRSCDLVTQRPSAGRTGLHCTCRAGPDSGYEGLPMEGPRLEFRTFDDRLSADAAANLRAENEALRQKVRELTTSGGGVPRPRAGVASATAEDTPPAAPGLRRFSGR